MSHADLKERFSSRSATVGVVGLGYVGLPVAVTFAREGFKVLGVDASEDKVARIAGGNSPLRDVPDTELAALVGNGSLKVGTSFASLADADAVIVCVPTPITDGAPDLSYVVGVATQLASVLTPDTLVILESTTYPGTTEELLRPRLEEGDLEVGTDLYLAYSPERIDPGNEMYSFADIPKIVGGVDEVSSDLAATLYEQVVPKVVRVSGTREAELSKLIENTFRHVNIALVNELAVYSHEMGIDIWEAIEAAATKPFGFMPFWPGPGWGGHCIPLDPSYLSWRVKRDRAHEVRFVELAQAVNSEMPRHVVERISLLLNDVGKAVKGAKVLGIGLAYKAGTEDTRESPAIKILQRLAKLGASVSYYDPLVAEAAFDGTAQTSVEPSEENFTAQDLVVIFVPQAEVDWALVEKASPLILDCCNALHKKGGKISRL